MYAQVAEASPIQTGRHHCKEQKPDFNASTVNRKEVCPALLEDMLHDRRDRTEEDAAADEAKDRHKLAGLIASVTGESLRRDHRYIPPKFAAINC